VYLYDRISNEKLVKVKKLKGLSAYQDNGSAITPLATESQRAGELNN
jgi:hypothetical protein